MCWIVSVSSRFWPSVQGGIIRSAVEVIGAATLVEVKKLPASRRWRRSSEVEFETHLAYSYLVNGKRYEGSRIECYTYLEQAKSNGELTRERLVGLEKGTSVTVYYNPLWPSSSILRRNLPGLYLTAVSFFFIIPLLLFGCTGMLFIAWFMIERILWNLGLHW